MDDFFMHLAPLPRRLPSGLALESIAYNGHKTRREHRTFETFNFSFILSGGGIFRFRGESIAVKAPCVFIQWPGELMDYGPCSPWETWEELSLIYPADQLDELRKRNLALLRKPLWNVRREIPMREQVDHLMSLLQSPHEHGRVDRIDRACELLVVESRLGESRPPLGRDESIIRQIRERVRTHYLEHHDFDALARDYGLSPSTFRRYWARYVHAPPSRYVMSLRIREACRLLVETDFTIAEIADQLRFDDPLYFSRRFSRLMGIPATEYRQRHKVHG
ncbi:MAG: helix-turn-helix transcriptional regulator [Verrucomicrobia bacterium]|nr:helix-turn-helix transcriptional regulator [Verrucomicrobiota bacterium]